MRRLLTLLALFGALTVEAQNFISLEGSWDFAVSNGKPAAYTDYVMLPGSMLTNGKGEPVSVKTA